MRFLFQVSRDWTHPEATGGDACMCDYARYLAQRGHDVTVLAARYTGSPRHELREGVHIVRLGGMFRHAIRTAAYYARHRNKFDVVFEEGMASVRLPFLAPLYVRKPLVSVWYQINREIFEEQYAAPVAKLLTWAERAVLGAHRRCTILALTEDRRRELVDAGCPSRNVHVVPPLMLDSQWPTTTHTDTPRTPTIIWIGKIRRYKCAHHAIEAMPEVVRRVPGARLVIAGRRDDAAYEQELRDLAQRLGVADHVELRLDITHDEKFALLSAARAAVVTAPVEGFSIVVIEANRCGTPVVATEGVPTDTAREGYNGYRVPFGDRAVLGEALVRLLADDAEFAALSANALVHAAEFSVARTGRRLDAVIDTLVRTDTNHAVATAATAAKPLDNDRAA